MPKADIDPDDAATIFFTSGSTGFPKELCRAIEILCASFSWELDLAARQMETGITLKRALINPQRC